MLITEPPPPVFCMRPIDIVVTMNATNPPTVSLCNRVAAPRAPNAACVAPPPNTDRSAPLPCWSNTTRIRNRETSTWMM